MIWVSKFEDIRFSTTEALVANVEMRADNKTDVEHLDAALAAFLGLCH